MTNYNDSAASMHQSAKKKIFENNNDVNSVVTESNGKMHQNGNLTKSSSFKDYKILNIDQQSQLKQPRASIRSTTSSNILNRTKKFLKGICLTILSGFFFSLTTLVVKYVNKQVSPGTTAGFRYLGQYNSSGIFHSIPIDVLFAQFYVDPIYVLFVLDAIRHHYISISAGLGIIATVVRSHGFLHLDRASRTSWWH